ncbi:MAG: hypothetical protein U0Q19_07685 [Kineosporiaceae bacterium]
MSEIMRQGLQVPVQGTSSGFPVFAPPPEAPIVTDDVVARHRDDDPTLSA